MPWRVSRVLDFRSHCTSVHAREADAKLDTGRQLGALLERLAAELPNYATRWHYPAVHPGFVEDAAEVLDVAGDLLAADRVWESYDTWQAFMSRWEGQINPPIWAQLGTVVVEGKGPTVPSSYQPLRLKEGCHTRPVEPQDVATITRDLIKHTGASARAQINLEMALENREVPKEVVDQVVKEIVIPALKDVTTSERALEYFMQNIPALQQRIEDELRKRLNIRPGIIEELLAKYPPPPPRSPKISGFDLGRWKVSRYAPGKPHHASIHYREEDAMQETAYALAETIERMEREVGAVEGMDEARRLLKAGNIWGAYERYMELEDDLYIERGTYPGFDVWGGIRVEVV